jgi:hypothetical protein
LSVDGPIAANACQVIYVLSITRICGGTSIDGHLLMDVTLKSVLRLNKTGYTSQQKHNSRADSLTVSVDDFDARYRRQRCQQQESQ